MMPIDKKLLGGVAIALLIIVGIAATLLFMNQPNPTAEQTPAPINKSSVSIENFSDYPELDITLRASIEEAINGFVQEVSPGTNAKGVIRQASYTSTPTDVGKNIIFLVDFQSIQVTYKVDLGVSSSDDEQILYIVCPSENELAYPPFKCKDSFSV